MTRTNTCVQSSAASSIQADLHALHTAPGKNSGFNLECSVVKSSVQRTCAAYGSPGACFFREFSFLECLELELSGGLCPFCV